VLVRPGSRPRQTEAEWRADQALLSASGTTATGTQTGTGLALSSFSKILSRLMPTAEAQIGFPPPGGPGIIGPYNELWSDAKNLVGSPNNRPIEATRLGNVLPESSNASFAVPLVNLGGRGIGTALNLYYNSRVWSRRNNQVAFDVLRGNPSPGFSVGVGELITYDYVQATQTVKVMWVEPDGTRHYLGSGPYSGNWDVTTTDGSDIRFAGNLNNYCAIYYPNGVIISLYGTAPTGIGGPNGNYIQIAYKPTQTCNPSCIEWPSGMIDYITDTLGRVIQFEYNIVNGWGTTLKKITLPNGETVSFFYQTQTLTTNFSGLTIENTGYGNSFSALKNIYFSATNTGHRFDYSDYGMIYNLSARRGMSINYSGVLQQGTENGSVVYNYPTSGSQLTDVPTFTQRTESAENAPTSTFTYSSSTDAVAQTKTFTITRPDSSTVNLTRSTDTSSIANGLLVQTEIKNGSTSLGKSVLTYVTAANAPRLQSVLAYDDMGVATKEDITYDSLGNVAQKREYGHQISGQWQVRRRTHREYKTNTGTWGLVTLTEVFDAKQDTNDTNDELIKKSLLTYDDYQAMGGVERYPGHPVAPGSAAANDPANFMPWDNVTGTTQWFNLAGNQSITRLLKYDMYGNVIKEQVSCCDEKSYMYTEDTGFGAPEEVISGNANGTNLTESNTIAYDTGQVVWSANANNQETTYSYDAAMRMRAMNLFTGAVASVTYDDGTLTTTSTTEYTENGITKTLTTTRHHDGWGRVIQEINPYGAQVNTAYNAMGQVTSVSNPFASGGSPSLFTTYSYDKVGRGTLVTSPDNSTVQSSYSGTTVTMTDHVNRKIKRESDGLGRLIKVTEPDVMTGTLNQETNYSYNLLNKLIEVSQDTPRMVKNE
jgi:YD repeat-containing protein